MREEPRDAGQEHARGRGGRVARPRRRRRRARRDGSPRTTARTPRASAPRTPHASAYRTPTRHRTPLARARARARARTRVSKRWGCRIRLNHHRQRRPRARVYARCRRRSRANRARGDDTSITARTARECVDVHVPARGGMAPKRVKSALVLTRWSHCDAICFPRYPRRLRARRRMRLGADRAQGRRRRVWIRRIALGRRIIAGSCPGWVPGRASGCRFMRN